MHCFTSQTPILTIFYFIKS
jgi:hypothetical protein